MSVNRLNYTGRKRIRRDCISIGMHGEAPNAVVGATFQFGDLGFPATARVVLEAYAGWIVQRFDFGTVDLIAPPNDTRLSEFDSTAGILFRVKVIGTGDREGRLLGIADQLRPSAEYDSAVQRAFVVVRPHDLGDRVWKLEIDNAQPVLLVNRRIPDYADFLRRPNIAALLLPEVLARLIDYAVKSEEDEGADAGWINLVIRMAVRFSGRQVPPSGDEEEVEEWIDEVVGSFSRRHQFLDVFSNDESGESR